MKRGDRVQLRIESLAFGGDAIGRASDGRVVFVPGGAPGDEVSAIVDEVKRGFARATLAEVVVAGPSRVAPRCPLVGECGGCQWQEVAASAQRAAKQAVIARALGRLGVTVAALATPSAPFGYRTRARFTVAAGGGGRVIGYQGRRSHAVVDVASCPLLDPALDAALGAARLALGAALPAGATLAGLAGRDGAVHLAIDLAGARPPPSLRAAALSLIGRAGIAGVVLDGARLGAPAIDTADDGEAPFHAAADGFAQASATGNRTLRRLVAEAAGADGARVLELHAGDGNFTRDLARVAKEVVAVEGDAHAIARLRHNAPSATAVCEPVERAVRRLADAGMRFDVAVIDPPRAGARAILPSLATLAPRLVYVSCDPMTLARDAVELTAAGLPPIRATGVDLMPQTFHVEVVCRFERAAEPATES